MGYFPFFVEIKGKKGLIVGGGSIACHKVEKLLPFEPELTVVAPDILAILTENRKLLCKKREFMDCDLEDMTFVIAASDSPEVNAYVSKCCKEKGILVNVVDDKEKCGFLFPALVKEGAFVAGISTEGISPQVAASVRSLIAEEIPGQMEAILDYLAEVRLIAKEKILDDRKRASFLKKTALDAMKQNRVFTMEETGKRMLEYLPENEAEAQKKTALTDCLPEKENESGNELLPGVVLVGAGCGAYDLITVRGLNAVRKAEVLVYDDLIDERLLSHAAESCEKIYVGKRNGKHSMRQEEINALLIEKAESGKYVVRLKGGDPYVFGRGGEEALELMEHKIPVAEIPGITSAIAIPAAAGVPVTHRGKSRSFHVITGHTKDNGEGLPKQLENLAALDGTLVFLMGLSHLEEIVTGLLKAGKEPETPAAVLHGDFNGKVDEVKGTLQNIVLRAEEKKIEPPAVIVIGETAEMNLCRSDI